MQGEMYAWGRGELGGRAGWGGRRGARGAREGGVWPNKFRRGWGRVKLAEHAVSE